MLSFEGSFYKVLLENTNWVSVAFWVMVTSFIGQFTMLFIRPVRQDIIKSFGAYRKKFGMFVLMECFDRLASLSLVFALALIPIIVDSGIQSVQPIFVAVYGIILAKLFGKRFHEDISHQIMIKKILCFIMISTGVMMTVMG